MTKRERKSKFYYNNHFKLCRNHANYRWRLDKMYVSYKTKTTHSRIQNKIIKNDKSLNTKK